MTKHGQQLAVEINGNDNSGCLVTKTFIVAYVF
jgi:hypothetical protein